MKAKAIAYLPKNIISQVWFEDTNRGIDMMWSRGLGQAPIQISTKFSAQISERLDRR